MLCIKCCTGTVWVRSEVVHGLSHPLQPCFRLQTDPVTTQPLMNPFLRQVLQACHIFFTALIPHCLFRGQGCNDEIKDVTVNGPGCILETLPSGMFATCLTPTALHTRQFVGSISPPKARIIIRKLKMVTKGRQSNVLCV